MDLSPEMFFGVGFEAKDNPGLKWVTKLMPRAMRKTFLAAAALLLAAIFVGAKAQSPPASPCVSTAIAGGTADAIIIPQLPCIPTTTLLILTVSQANQTATPTITPAGGLAQVIKRYDGSPLSPGDMPSGAHIALTNNGAAWFLLAPAQGATVNARLVTGLNNLTEPITNSNEGAEITGNSDGTLTAEQIADWAFCNGCSLVVSHSGVRGIGHLTSRSTIQLVNGVEGYTLIDTPNTVAGVPTGVSLWGTSVVDVNGGESWGVNTVSTDNKGQTISSGTGRQLYGYEADFNVTSPNTNVLGMVVQGASLSQPHISNGYSCGPLSFAHSEVLWGSCFISDDSVTDVGLAIGLSNTGITGAYPPAPAANTGSQLIEMGYSLSGTRYTAAIQASYEVGDGGGLGAIMLNNTNAAVPTNVGVNQGFFSPRIKARRSRRRPGERASSSGHRIRLGRIRRAN